MYYKKLSANKYYEFCEIISQFIILKKIWNSCTFIIVFFDVLYFDLLIYENFWQKIIKIDNYDQIKKFFKDKTYLTIVDILKKYI